MQEFDQNWQKLSEEVLVGMKEWRQQHPKATFTEIEEALDERLGRLRARMLQDAALASASGDWSQASPEERPKCPLCGTPLVARGKKTRHLQTHGGQDVALSRSHGVCPTCESGFFPPR
ncbi:MAG: YgiT-type zinc finger protein [Ktedonobacteraceae bacterium]